MNFPITVTALIASHNRREATLRCIESLYGQVGIGGKIQLRIVLLDDGSSDGTPEAVQASHPQVVLLRGDGKRFWAGGMHIAWSHAAKDDPDAYLLINDDTHLDQEVLERMLEQHIALGLASQPGILVGSTRDPLTGIQTYGGARQASRWRPFSLSLVPVSDRPVPCDTFNANCVWIPRSVVAKIGRFGNEFQHAMADTDYGFRARKHGIPNWVLPGTVGTCALNPGPASWKAPGLSLRQRWKAIRSPKGLPPGMWFRLCFRHAGLVAPLLAVWPYLKLILSWPSRGPRHP